MPVNIPFEVWLLAAFVGTCVGLGFVAGYIARRRSWNGWTIGVGSTGVGLLWPVALFVIFFLTTGPCKPRSPSDPCDGPAMLLMSIIVTTPPLFAVGVGLALGGALIAWRRFRVDSPPNNSLDRRRERIAKAKGKRQKEKDFAPPDSTLTFSCLLMQESP